MPFDWEAVFNEELDKAIAEELDGRGAGFPLETWTITGLRPRQDEEWWRANGPEMAKNFADWYEGHDDINVWVTPDGEPAIELALEVPFGSVNWTGRIDLVLEAGSALVVTDVKSGSYVPDGQEQLGLYACAIEWTYGFRPRYGSYFMARGKTNRKNDDVLHFMPPIDLSGPEHSFEYYTRLLEEADQGQANGPYLPKRSRLCDMCGVNYACTSFGGLRARNLDPSHPEYGKWAAS